MSLTFRSSRSMVWSYVSEPRAECGVHVTGLGGVMYRENRPSDVSRREILYCALLSQFYLAEQVAVDELAMIESLLQIVFVPVISGFCFRAVLPRLSAALQPALPLISVICILLIIGIVVALNAPQLRGIGPLIDLAVILHNALGIAGGFTLSPLFGFDLKQSQTIAIEVGMQNSGLAAALSLQFFSATAALPAALFSIWHNISGALLAGHWGRQRDSLKYLLADVKDSEMDGA